MVVRFILVICLFCGFGTANAQNSGSYQAQLLRSRNFPSEFRTIDGSGNNKDNPVWGKAEHSFLRIFDAAYEDGVSAPRDTSLPSARMISNTVSAQSGSIPNSDGASDFLWQWGQFIDHDLDETLVASPVEYYPILVPMGDPHFDPFELGFEVIPLSRSAFEFDQSGVRQQTNAISSYIDASNVYGSDEIRAAALRANDGTGRLKTGDSPVGEILPANLYGLPNAGGPGSNLFLAGDVRANEQIALTAMHTLFVREHNYWAEQIGRINRNLSGDEIYQFARMIVAAEMQAITYREFLPVLLGSRGIPAYKGYNSQVDASVSNVFATAAYRVGHTMLSSELQLIYKDGARSGDSLPLQNAFFRPDRFVEIGLEPILRGLASQRSQRIDTRVIDDVRNFLFGPPGAGGFDLASLNIQRGRDHGIPPYNEIRRALGLEELVDFSDYEAVEKGLDVELGGVYSSVEDIDAWVGLLGERHVRGAVVGETLQAILADQFTRTRDGDRFWYQNYLPVKLQGFVEKQTLATIIKRNTGIKKIQGNVFRVRHNGNPRFHNGPCIHPELERNFRNYHRKLNSIESILEQLDH